MNLVAPSPSRTMACASSHATSITAARDWKAVNGLDFDFSSADILYRDPVGDESYSGFKQFSQEFRLTGATDRMDWMVGMFYSHEDLARNESYRIGGYVFPGALFDNSIVAFYGPPRTYTATLTFRF